MRISDWSSDVCSSDLHSRHDVADSQPGVFMTFIALLASSLLLSSAASAQAATRYDLNCKNKVTVMRIGSTTRETVSSPKRLSIDLAAKLWFSRHDDMTCGPTSPITIDRQRVVKGKRVSGR